MGHRACFELALPGNFRRDDFFSFHRRDPVGLCEQVEGLCLHKGMIWNGQPACLALRFEEKCVQVVFDVEGSAADPEAVEWLASHLVGLDQPVDDFERAHGAHPVLGALIHRHPGLRVPQTATPFEALSWAIAAQQVSVKSAVSLRRRLVERVGLRHSCGLYCYPDAQAVDTLTVHELQSLGFSATKAGALKALSSGVLAGHLPLDEWMRNVPLDVMRERLLEVRGIGPWTVDYALLRGFGWLDGSLHGDVAVRRQLQQILLHPVPMGLQETQDWLKTFSPWRALVAAHLWAA